MRRSIEIVASALNACRISPMVGMGLTGREKMEITGRRYSADGVDTFSLELTQSQEDQLRQLARAYADQMGSERPVAEDYLTAAITLHGRRGCAPNLSHGDILIDAVEQ